MTNQYYKIFFLALPLALLLFSGCQQSPETGSIYSKLLIASVSRDDGPKINIDIFDAQTYKVINSSSIPVPQPVSSYSNYFSFGSNSAVQYDDKTNVPFYVSSDFDEYEGVCANSQPYCYDNVFRADLRAQTSTVLFKLESQSLKNWVVNSSDNSILLSYVSSSSQIFSKIDTVTGKEIFSSQKRPWSEYAEYGLLVLSRDHKKVFQTQLAQSKNDPAKYDLTLLTVDCASGAVSEKIIYSGYAITCDTNISSDGDYIAWYAEEENIMKLFVLDLRRDSLDKISLEANVANYNLLWSGDGVKILYHLKDQVRIYNVKTGEKKLLENKISKNINYLYLWAPSDDQIVFQAKNGSKFVYNTTEDTILDIPITSSTEVHSFMWLP